MPRGSPTPPPAAFLGGPGGGIWVRVWRAGLVGAYNTFDVEILLHCWTHLVARQFPPAASRTGTARPNAVDTHGRPKRDEPGGASRSLASTTSRYRCRHRGRAQGGSR